jgi:Ca2+-binding EF-hand superfamily protein
MTLTLNDVNAMTFFTCASRDLMGAAAARVSLSPEGCAIILSRIRRRLEAAGLSVTDIVALFTVPGERELTAEQWQEVATSLPLGISRAEMQQLFFKVDAAETGRIQIAQLESLLNGASSALCTTAPPYISAALRRGLSARIREELQKLGGVNGATLSRESDFKRVVMQTERYLTSDQLSSLSLLTDKSPQGLIDYQEFAERFGGGVPGMGVPGGKLPSSVSAWSATQAPTSDDEIRAVGSRTAVVMERQGLTIERLPALVLLWGGAIAANDMAKVLAILPLGLSFHEASSLVQFAGGSLPNLAAQLGNLRSQGVWSQWCQWAAQNIPGPSLQAVLKQQVVEAECRTLDPQEFVRNLTDAGVKASDTGLALWLTEKTAQGDVCVAEFLACFGGSGSGSEQKKKKRGLFPSFFRR